MRPIEDSGKPRPTLRSLAREAGVTAMTVSLALRNHPSIPLATRERLQALAKQRGYTPDPTVRKLMNHLRTQKARRLQATICGLRSSPPSAQEQDYGDQIALGAREHAEASGYSFENIWLDSSELRGRSLQRILRNRGVEGLILLPMGKPLSLVDLLNWEDFAAVAASFSILAPHFHSVVPDQFGNMMSLCHFIAGRKFRKPGFVSRAGHDVRVNHRFTAALAWHQKAGVFRASKPCIVDAWPPAPDLLMKWFLKEKPDAIICDSEPSLLEITSLLPPKAVQKLGLFSTGLLSPDSRFSGINERPREIGAVAVDVLSGYLQRGIRGIPDSPNLTMVHGHIVGSGTR